MTLRVAESQSQGATTTIRGKGGTQAEPVLLSQLALLLRSEQSPGERRDSDPLCFATKTDKIAVPVMPSPRGGSTSTQVLDRWRVIRLRSRRERRAAARFAAGPTAKGGMRSEEPLHASRSSPDGYRWRLRRGSPSALPEEVVTWQIIWMLRV